MEILKKTSGARDAWPAGGNLRIGLAIPLANSRLFQVTWLFFKTGLLSFDGAYASLVFVQRGAVAQYH